MSHEATEAVLGTAPMFGKAIAQLPVKRRPSADRAWLVALRLADRYRDHRGYVDSSIEQLSAEVAYLFDPGPSCRALHEIGMWVITKQGGPGYPTQRSMGPMLEEQVGADPNEFWDDDELVGADPHLLCEGGAHRVGVDDEQVGVNAQRVGVERHRVGADPNTPPDNHHLSTSTSTKTSSASFEKLNDYDDDEEPF